jgi:hypothetical protein
VLCDGGENTWVLVRYGHSTNALHLSGSTWLADPRYRAGFWTGHHKHVFDTRILEFEVRSSLPCFTIQKLRNPPSASLDGCLRCPRAGYRLARFCQKFLLLAFGELLVPTSRGITSIDAFCSCSTDR